MSQTGRRKVKIILSGLEVIGIRWRIEEHRVPDYKTSIKLDPCVYCGKESESWEHIKPKSKGGKDGWSNIARACHSCNSKRDTTPFLLFLIQRHKNGN